MLPWIGKICKSERPILKIGYWDLGRFDVMISEGFCPSRSDSIGLAIRTQFNGHASTVEQSIHRVSVDMVVREFTLRAPQSANEGKQNSTAEWSGVFALKTTSTIKDTSIINLSMQFDSIAESTPADKWLGRWNRCWPSYRKWFLDRGGDKGPSRMECEAALLQHMPELVPIWKTLSKLTGNDDLAARFLASWCPPAYLGGCSLAALSGSGTTRLVRNYDLSPDLNEGLLLRTEWSGTPVMGMIEFLWGLSDGINQHGLAVALAFGGSSQVNTGFGITTILRYVMETCRTVEQALSALERVPSHMAYNIALADASGATAVAELKAGGGMTISNSSVATNHQHGTVAPDTAEFTQTFERFKYLEQLAATDITPCNLANAFLEPPLFQFRYEQSLGTLFTADYNPASRSLQLLWPAATWSQSLDDFQECTKHILFSGVADTAYRQPANTQGDWLSQLESLEKYASNQPAFNRWIQKSKAGEVHWGCFAKAFTPTHPF